MKFGEVLANIKPMYFNFLYYPCIFAASSLRESPETCNQRVEESRYLTSLREQACKLSLVEQELVSFISLVYQSRFGELAQ